MKTVPRRSNEEKRAIVRDVEPYVLDVYIKATVWSLTMSGSTGEVLWRGSQLVWFLATRTG